jgi:dTDP-4-amino-4,6-dideoxygalactose transaminase
VGIGRGDEVITTPITFAATANSVLYCGGTPIFADIDPKTWQLSPEAVEARVSGRTRAVIAVDYTGEPCDYDALRAVCDRHGLVLIEDAAHALGSRYKGRPLGGVADLTAFSFHPVKTATSGEGGAVTTNDAAYARKLELVTKHGITRDPETTGADGGWYYEMIELGGNYRITDIQCALLGSQLDKLPRFARRRKALTLKYNEAFQGMPQLTLQREYPGSDTVRHLYVVRLDRRRLRVDRKRVFDALRAENIGVNVHYIPVYTFPYYARMGYMRGICPHAEALYGEILTLPLFYAMSDADADDVITAVKKVLNHYEVGE